MESVRGFVLQPTYRIESGRPVVHLYGCLEDGRSFLVRDSRQAPRFYIRSSDAGAARKMGARPLEPTECVTLDGDPVVRVEVRIPSDTPPLRNRLRKHGIQCFEADVRFAMRYLIDRGVRGTASITGEARAGDGIDLVFDEPDVTPAEWMPELKVLSYDIEIDTRTSDLLAISLDVAGESEVFLHTPEGLPCPGGAISMKTPGEVLEAFCRRTREIDPDVLTGWNINEFDFPTLCQLAKRYGVLFELGRGPGEVRMLKPRSRREATRVSVPGRVVLDGIQLLRGAFVRFDEYSLDAVARRVLGSGKTLAGKGRSTEIVRMFREDRERFVEYSRTDARLVTDILEKLDLVKLAVERSRLTGLPPDRVSGSIAAFDFLYLSELGRRKVVGPTADFEEAPGEPNAGGHVLQPEPGLYRNVVAYDFKSLYPSVIRTFQIDPFGYQSAPSESEDPIVAPNGAAFRRQEGILTGILDKLFPQREEAKANRNWIKSHAIKILMNSFYGVLGTPACRFHNPQLANAITSFGREVLLWSKSRIEGRGYRVLYGDTDSLFVDSGESIPDRANELGKAMASELNRDLALHIEKKWKVKSRLELEFETLYLRFLLPTTRGSSVGARKRYAGLVERDGEKRVEFTGLEVVRRDWTDLAKVVQRELYDRLFFDRPVGEYLREIVSDLRQGRLDEQLIYRKGLRKKPEAYTKATPPHVAAARKMSEKPGRIVSYVITTHGPEPANERMNPFDYTHYIEKQIRPVAEPVLAFLDVDFDAAAGTDPQLRLF